MARRTTTGSPSTDCVTYGRQAGVYCGCQTATGGKINNITITHNTISLAAPATGMIVGVQPWCFAGKQTYHLERPDIAATSIHDITGCNTTTESGIGISLDGCNATLARAGLSTTWFTTVDMTAQLTAAIRRDRDRLLRLGFHPVQRSPRYPNRDRGSRRRPIRPRRRDHELHLPVQHRMERGRRRPDKLQRQRVQRQRLPVQYLSQLRHGCSRHRGRDRVRRQLAGARSTTTRSRPEIPRARSWP